MAEALPQLLGRQVSGFTALPLPRQFGLLAGFAAVVALVITLGNWALSPTYQVLLPGLGERDKAQAITVLTRNGMPNRLDPVSGALMVPAPRAHEARLQLATDGIPREAGIGFELLDQETGIGTSRMVENTRYQRALEGELARSVTTLHSVDSARVHLALPRQSVFVRDRKHASASVLVNLHPGRVLDEAQVAGVVHLVASSVPELEPERVTIVDQRGRLLSQPEQAANGALTVRHLDYTRRVEDSLRERVEAMLIPLLGESGMRVQVTADMDFTQVESTRESYDGDRAALRSEQLAEETSRNGIRGGVPGALTNQPPGAATLAELDADGVVLTGEETAEALPGSRSSRSTRNYEVDRTIEHTRQAPASLKRLSVAVVVDHREVLRDGEAVREPRDAAELDYLASLVREAVGFDETRGDSVNLVNASFRALQQDPALEPAPFWEEVWFRDLVKQGLAALGLLIVVLFVVRPALHRLAQPAPATLGTRDLAALAAQGGELEDDSLSLGGSRPRAVTFDDRLQSARKVATEDPRLAAQVVRQWMRSDEAG